MVTDHVRKTLHTKSKAHQASLRRLGKTFEDMPLSTNVVVLEQTPQVMGINTLILDPKTGREDFIFYFDRIAVMLIERYVPVFPEH